MDELSIMVETVFGSESPQAKWFSTAFIRAELKSPGDFLHYVDLYGDEVVARVLSTTREKVFDLYNLCRSTINETVI